MTEKKLPEERVLDVRNFSLDLATPGGNLPVLQDIHFHIRKGEFLSLVGESGCGKSVCSLALTRLLPKQLAVYRSGEVDFQGRNLLNLPADELRKIRGNDISYIFQEPFSSLNPLHRIEDQLVEGYLAHGLGGRTEALEKASYLLSRVGITDIQERMRSYPNQMSGGMLQRICIAMALMCDPILLIADEPTSAIDVTIQSQLIELLFELKSSMNLSVLFISHDVALVSRISDRIAVMYAGTMMESGTVDAVIDTPKHPYTQALLRAYPSLKEDTEELEPIPGMVPSLGDYPAGCHFSDRCRSVMECCHTAKPNSLILENNQEVACYLYARDSYA